MDPTVQFYHSDDARAMAALSSEPPQRQLLQHNGNVANPQQHVVAMHPSRSPPHVAMARARKESWSWASTVCSTVATLLCCSPCALLGLLFSVLAYTDHKVGDARRADGKRRWAWFCTVLAFLLMIAAVVALVVLFVTKPSWLNLKLNNIVNNIDLTL